MFVAYNLKGMLDFREPDRMREGLIGLDDSKGFADTIVRSDMDCVGTIMRCTFCEGSS